VETARCSSSRPPLQNISKSKEAQFEAILGRYVRDRDMGEIKPLGNYLDLFGRPLYRFPVRSILRSTPGRVLIEADYTGAELAIMAWQSGDPQMIEDIARNLLPEDHPDYLDLHSQTAVSAFHLDCPPTKKGLESLGKLYLRTGAKPINFGVPYGISPAAIALKCLAEGCKISIDEANAMRDGYFTRWPGTKDYLDEAASRVTRPGWIAGPHGRFRRFYADGVDERTLAELQRQAWNYTIQNGVADTISQAMGELVAYRQADGGRPRFDLVLQIHDALLVECDPVDVEYTVAALKECMCRRVPIHPRRLDGTPTGTGPYRFGVEVDLYEHWGVKLSDERARELGAPDKAAIKKMIMSD
jgi:DNA polymerase-1